MWQMQIPGWLQISLIVILSLLWATADLKWRKGARR